MGQEGETTRFALCLAARYDPAGPPDNGRSRPDGAARRGGRHVRNKPDAEFFRAVLDAIVLPPSRVLFIDDHARNVAAARELGIHGALFPYGAGALMLRCTLQAFGLRNA